MVNIAGLKSMDSGALLATPKCQVWDRLWFYGGKEASREAPVVRQKFAGHCRTGPARISSHFGTHRARGAASFRFPVSGWSILSGTCQSWQGTMFQFEFPGKGGREKQHRPRIRVVTEMHLEGFSGFRVGQNPAGGFPMTHAKGREMHTRITWHTIEMRMMMSCL